MGKHEDPDEKRGQDDGNKPNPGPIVDPNKNGGKHGDGKK